METLSRGMRVIDDHPRALKRTRGGSAFPVKEIMHTVKEAEIDRYTDLVADVAAEVAAVKSDRCVYSK